MNPIEYLVSKGFKITSDPNEYYEQYNPNKGKKPWGQRDYTAWYNGELVNHDRYCGGQHPAYDFAKAEGADLPAVVDGTIVAGTKTPAQGGNFGGTVVLADNKGDYQYIYGHCKNLQVKVGDKVKQGQKLAEQSNTNYYNDPMFSHLHVQVQHQKYYADEKTFVCTGIDPLRIDINKYVGNSTGNAFLDKVLPHAQSQYKNTKILPSIVMAQAALESAWGKSELATKANNLFGVKGDYKGKSYTKRTREEDKNGKSYYVNAPFRKYPSFKESIADHGAFFVSSDWRKKNYAPVLKAKDYKTQAKALQSCGYATDTKYASKLINLIEEYGLAQFDSGKQTITPIKPSNSSKPTSSSNEQTIRHIVKRGQTLYSIAKLHGISVDKLKSMNNLSSNLIKTGQKLIVGKKATTTKKPSSKTPRTIGEWKVNKQNGAQYIKAEGTFTVTAKDGIVSRFDNPSLNAPEGGAAEKGWSHSYDYLVRADGHVWIQYKVKGSNRWKFLPFDVWDSKTGQVGGKQWGTFS